MGSFWMHTSLSALCCVLFMARIHGELIMIRHPKVTRNKITSQNLTCIAGDDGTAFVWNGKFNDIQNDTGSDEISCFQSEKCSSDFLNARNTSYGSGWAGDDSKKHPMGPVYDYGWEDFPGYHKTLPYLNNLPENGTIVFSARGSDDINLKLGGKDILASDSCYRITLAGPMSKRSAIRYCNATGSNVSTNSTKPPGESKSNESLLSLLEWHTFIIKWTSNEKVEVFTNTKKIMDIDVDQRIKLNRISVDKNSGNFFRFHDYTYSRARETNKTLTFSDFKYERENFQVELIVSLCPECQFKVLVIDENGTELAKTIIAGRRTDVVHNLPMWQVEKWTIPPEMLLTYKGPIKLTITTAGEGSTTKSWWAYRSFRTNGLEGDRRESTRELLLSSDMPDATCQALSYSKNESATIHSNSKISNLSSSNFDQYDQYLRKKGNVCDFKKAGSCKEVSICDRSGCTCARGFTGNDCTKDCPQGTYGYNCQKDCNNCGNKICDSVTGNCKAECRDHFISPDCERKLGPPKISCIGDTKLKLDFSTPFPDNETTDLRLEIKRAQYNWSRKILSLNRSNWLESLEDMKIMKPWTKYNVRAVLNETTYPQTNFDTNCWKHSKLQDFSAIPQNDGNVILKWKHHRHYWERTKEYEISIGFLNSSLTGNPVPELPNATECWSLSETDPTVCRRNLSLSATTNYIFSVKAIDELYKNSTVVRVWYLVPDDIGFAGIETKKVNDTMESIKLRLSHLSNNTEETIVNVILKRSNTCPILERSQNLTNYPNTTDPGICWPGNLEAGGYPAWPLLLNETYVFMVVIDVPQDGESHLMWLVVLPASTACLFLLYFLYGKYTGIPLKLKIRSTLVGYVAEARLQPINVPDEPSFDRSVPPEVQKFRSFENYVRRAAEDGVLQQQFSMLPRGLLRSCECGRLPGNKRKNGYGNLIAYDETRVLLARNATDIHSDYINANYVHGYCKERAYIATQGPLPQTVIDFWRMIWQEEVRIICMLVDLNENGKTMCARYWPEVGEEISYGDVVILTTHQRVSTDYTFRTFLVTSHPGVESQIVQHLQYTGWPEQGVPMYSHSVVEYLQKLLSVAPGQGPIVVHCSSGTGRTGAIILSDIVLRHLAAEGTVDVFAEAKRMYGARANMLSNFAQYVLAHLVPTQCLLMLPTKVLCADVNQGKMEEMKNDIPAHMARLEECSWMDKALRPLEPIRPPDQEKMMKNRFPKLIPVGPSLVTLKQYPKHDSNSQYISAVSVDGVKIRKQYLASQLPMPSTLRDFWRLVVEKNVELVIILQHPDPEDQTCCAIIPRGTTMIPVPYLKVESKTSSKSSEYFVVDKLLLTDTSQEPARTRNITALTCNNWSTKEDARPPAPETLVELWKASEKIQREGPTLVLCYNGVTGCGLYLALSFMLERMAVEQECDVVLAVRAIRRSRADFVSSQWQFEYLYDAAVTYAESFQNYGNFAGAVRSTNRLYDYAV